VSNSNSNVRTPSLAHIYYIQSFSALKAQLRVSRDTLGFGEIDVGNGKFKFLSAFPVVDYIKFQVQKKAGWDLA